MTLLAVLVWKDLVAELRSRELVTSMGLVAAVALVVQGLALQGAPGAGELAPAVLWVTVAFAATLGLARSQALEQEYRAGSGLLLTPVGRGTLFAAKCVANTLLVVVLQALVVAGAAVFVESEIGSHATALALPLVLGAVGFAAAGTLVSPIALATRLREVLLPILLLPVVLPIVIVSASATAQVLAGASLRALAGPLRVLLAFDTVFVVLGFWLYEYVVEE